MDKPHAAYIVLKIEIYEKLPTGEVSGQVQRYTRDALSIHGSSKKEVEEKVEKLRKLLIEETKGNV